LYSSYYGILVLCILSTQKLVEVVNDDNDDDDFTRHLTEDLLREALDLGERPRCYKVSQSLKRFT
jgi:hypothetical protein